MSIKQNVISRLEPKIRKILNIQLKTPLNKNPEVPLPFTIDKNMFANKKYTINEICGYCFPKGKDGTTYSHPWWWGRPFEYPFAMQHIIKKDIVLDAGCGIGEGHRLKYWLAQNSSLTFAVDSDIRVKFLDNPFKNLILLHRNMENTGFPNNFFDKIICVSVIEHCSMESRYKILLEFYRILKDLGRIILTFDYPDIQLGEFEKYLKSSKLYYEGTIDMNINEDTIISPDGKKAYCTILKKVE